MSGPVFPQGYGGNGNILHKDLVQQAVAPRTVAVNALDSAVGHSWPTPLPDTPGHSQESLA